MEQITLYSTHCPQCRALETKLQRKNIEYNIIDDKDIMLSLGFKAAPVLQVGDKIFNFAQAVKWVNDIK